MINAYFSNKIIKLIFSIILLDDFKIYYNILVQ